MPLWKPKFHHHVNKIPPLDSIKSRLNAVHTFMSYISKINFNIILPCTPWPSKSSTEISGPRLCISRALCQMGLLTKWLIYGRLNSCTYLVWQMCNISVHMPKCNCLYLCVEQHQYYALLAWHPSILCSFTKYLRLCRYVDTPFWHHALDIIPIYPIHLSDFTALSASG
jgi:hypothetical protein